ncbi:MAG: class I SAM-dependent methyltransferase [Terrimicrobiaceae bacterium]|nr:class I SAM-dependent methyltransferase [Terrimicrobiaceae bacterium]
MASTAFSRRIAIDKNDAYDRAYLWAWEEGGMRELLRLCYKTPDFPDNARRFHASDEFRALLAMLAALGVAPSPSSKVLDFGCGNGVASYAFAREGFNVTGMDSSAGLLAGLGAAKKLNGLDGVKVNFRFHSGEKLDIEPNSFDVVYIREVLHHIHSLVEFLRQIRTILKPGGVVCCLRDVVIWNESQRADFFAKHPLNFITKDENCYYLDEYLLAFVNAELTLRKVLAPPDSVINTYPAPFVEGVRHDAGAVRARSEGYEIFSFFAMKPLEPAQAGEPALEQRI